MILFNYKNVNGGNNLNERIRKIRKEKGLTMEKFGERLGVKKSTISQIENGKSNVTEQMFVAICREFDVNEEWLRTGKGEMYRQMSQHEKAANIVGKMLKSDNKFIQEVFIALGEMSEDEWDVVQKFVDNLKKAKENADNS